MTFTVYHWLELTVKGTVKPCLDLFCVKEGRIRSADATWAKVIEADNWRAAFAIAKELAEKGDPGDPLDSIPVYVHKTEPMQTQPQSQRKSPQKKGQAA